MKCGSMVRTRRILLACGVVLAALSLAGCSDGTDGQDGQDGQDGAPGVNTGTLTGTVTNSLTGAPLAGATIATDPVIPGVNVVTGPTGAYTATLPVGSYDLTCDSSNCTQGTASVSIVADTTTTLDFALVPTSPVMVSIGAPPSSPSPGATFDLSATVTVMDGSTVTGYSWTQTASAAATIQNGSTATATITLGDVAAYKAELLAHVDVLDRWYVMGFSPLAMEEAGHVAFQVEVTTSSGTYIATVDVHAHLEFATISTGLRNVPIRLPVTLGGMAQASYTWTFNEQPVGSGATMQDATTRHPWFVPDVSGRYVVQVNDIAAGTNAFLTIWAGTWEGAISGISPTDGLPEAVNCTGCHAPGGLAPDMFTDWRASGHAEIFTYNLNNSGYWGPHCFSCHTVGFNTAVANSGIDEADDYSAWLGAGLVGSPSPQNWMDTVVNFPNTAKKANIQCENCHGPQNGGGHIQGDPRISLSSDVCAVCHGEPKRHARFQQWELAGHSDYELALDEGWDSGDQEFRSCGACHTANGFIEWVKDGAGDASWRPPADLVSGPGEIHAITCVACHDPHDVGTTSGSGNDAEPRITGDTPMLQSDFEAISVGKGATCMTCHNARRGERNDSVWSGFSDSERGRAPHGGPQSDILMGRNAYFVETGTRGAHSLIADTCVTCHMSLTPPPEELSYNLGGTNHTFAASEEICGDCHGAFTAENVKSVVETLSHKLEDEIKQAILNEIEYIVDTLGFDLTISASEGDVVIDDFSLVGAVTLTEYRGRQAMNIVYDGSTYTNIRYGQSTDWNDGDTLLTSAYGQLIGKAGWNYWIVHSDGSHGFHNPSWAIKILEAAIDALQNASVPPPPT